MMVTGSEPIRLPCVGLHESYGECTQGEHKRKTTPANSQHCKKHQQRCRSSQGYKFAGHTSQKMHPNRWRTLLTTCLSVEQRISNCTFNIISQ
jgi:hypothetical protein